MDKVNKIKHRNLEAQFCIARGKDELLSGAKVL